MTNAELIAELRGHILSVPLTLLHEAADALEAADEKIADCVAAVEALDDSNDMYIKENERLKTRIAELEQIAKHYEQSAEDWWKEAFEYKQRIAELEAQLPKEGEWIDELRHEIWELRKDIQERGEQDEQADC